MRETVTDYETTEVTREVIRSDLSGSRIPEDEVVTLAANPRYTGSEIASDGKLELATDEFAELSDVEPESLTPGDELPKVLAKREEVQVVEEPLFDAPIFTVDVGPGGDENLLAWFAGVCVFGSYVFFGLHLRGMIDGGVLAFVGVLATMFGLGLTILWLFVSTIEIFGGDV